MSRPTLGPLISVPPPAYFVSKNFPTPALLLEPPCLLNFQLAGNFPIHFPFAGKNTC